MPGDRHISSGFLARWYFAKRNHVKPGRPKERRQRMESKNYAEAINQENIGKLVQYHFDGAWRVGTLDGFTEDSVRVKEITGGGVQTGRGDGTRLEVRQPQQSKA